MLPFEGNIAAMGFRHNRLRFLPLTDDSYILWEYLAKNSFANV